MVIADNTQSFVGRQAELTALRAELAAVRSGRPRVVLLEGTPGTVSYTHLTLPTNREV